MITFAWENNYAKFYREAEPLILRHWWEAGTHNDKIDLKIDHNIYFSLERMGKLNILVARDKKQMVGYLFILIAPYVRNHTLLHAQDDIIYVMPEYRPAWTGYKMLKEAIALARSKGCKMISLRRKSGHGSDKFMARLGLVPNSTTYTMVLE